MELQIQEYEAKIKDHEIVSAENSQMHKLKCAGYEKTISEMDDKQTELLKKQQEYKLQFMDLHKKMGETQKFAEQ